MTDNSFTIRIESILGGHSPASHFASEDQFQKSLGIDPSLPVDDDSSGNSSGTYNASGLLRPVSCKNIGSTSTINDSPFWIIDNPKNGIYYVYDFVGSVYTINTSLNAVTGLGDLNDGGTATGNGAAYYDNYVYFARNTTVARYGPLNGVPVFTDDYWVGTLGKTALVNTTYPVDFLNANYYPNHIMHRHSDGKLYIADVVDNKGTIHFISTTKTAVEGDTDSGSTYGKVQVGYGLWPVAMESYGSNLVIAFLEGTDGQLTKAKIAFWDTTSQNVNQITWVEFPDPLVTALKNINGVLYVVSGNLGSQGFRITRYVGGYTFEDVYFSEDGIPPRAGAVEGEGNRLLFGSYVEKPTFGGSVYSIGLQKSVLSKGVFSIMRTSDPSANITSIKSIRSNQKQTGIAYSTLVVGWTTGSESGIDVVDGSTYGTAESVWWSQRYRVGRPFKIKKVRVPLTNDITSGVSIIPKVYIDDDQAGHSPFTLKTIDFSSYPGAYQVVLKPENLTGFNNFWLELTWDGTRLMTISLPIIIDCEYIQDE
jgi:hypothetical protein